MEEIIEKLENLKKVLDNDDVIKTIKVLNKKLKKDNDLNKLIQEYQISRSEEVKAKIFKNELYLEYKHYENEVNFIILRIRKELSKINSRRGCIKNEDN